jgi:hypothetical protein
MRFTPYLTYLLLGLLLIPSGCRENEKVTGYTGQEYTMLKAGLIDGWNTWNTYSVLSHVLLPDALSINIYARDYESERTLKNAFIGNKVPRSEVAIPGDHTYNGSYTDLKVGFERIGFRVQTTSENDDLIILITPIADSLNEGSIVIDPRMLWGRTGEVLPEKDCMYAALPGKQIKIYPSYGKYIYNPADTTFEFPITDTIAITTGQPMKIENILSRIQEAHDEIQAVKDTSTMVSEIIDAIQTVTAWNTIYDPTKDRIITPVSRIWNTGWNGYVLFCWDNYFVSYMISPFNKEVAYANAIEITNEITESGFIPNFAATGNLKSRDRSQPPVGSMMVKEIYRKYREKWFLYEVYDELLTWNRWWPEHRDNEGLLCWGSDPYRPLSQDPTELVQNCLQGAKYESGLDNSPMYDDAGFDTITHQMMLADVGLTSLYIADCNALAEIAYILGKDADARELLRRASRYTDNLEELWDKWFGLHLNMHTDTREFSKRISPTNFYPLLAKSTTQNRADMMINSHFFYSNEFYGDWIIPSIARNDPAYNDNSYWRGRIWAPMNFLVYLGLRNYELSKTREKLAEKSAELLLKDWRQYRFVHENYNAETGEGNDVRNSDNFYHWGGLLGFIWLIEHGYVLPPEEPLTE